jgi:hypothetical protein
MQRKRRAIGKRQGKGTAFARYGVCFDGKGKCLCNASKQSAFAMQGKATAFARQTRKLYLQGKETAFTGQGKYL